MNDKLKVAVVFGGKSGEHEVSLMSATSVITNINKDKYQLYMIGITKDGVWNLYNGEIDKIQSGEWEKEGRPIVFPGDPSFKGFFAIEEPSRIYKVDIVFPVLHGPNGEDGTIQGLFELAGIPYVGCGVMASAAAMDKGTAKAIFSSIGLPQGDYIVVERVEYKHNQEYILNMVESKFGYPCFIKPVNMGSSVGITKAHNREELILAFEEAGKYDRKIIIEQFINCREIECSVLGNSEPKVSVMGEILPSKEFYDYQAKYLDGDSSGLVIPADIPEDIAEQLKDIAVKAYKSLDCSGLSRVDFFLEKETNKIYINEINTMPGFTRISMYSKLWNASGIEYSELIDRLIELAMDRYKEKDNIYG